MQDGFEKLSHCRFCGENKKIEHLFDLSSNKTILQEFMTKLKSMKIDFIELKCEFLPKTACESCYKFIHDYYSFFQRMKETQVYLTNIYKRSSNHVIQDVVKIENDNESFEPDNALDIIIVKNTNTIFKQDSVISEIDAQYMYLNIKPQESDTQTLHSKSRDKISTHLKNKTQLKKKKHSVVKKYFKTKLSSKTTNIDDDVKDMLEMPLENKINIIEGDLSWADYAWACMHCQAKFDSINAVRDHSKVVHATCFGFQCADCSELFNYFNPFIEHVRQHSESLRLHCQFCNIKSSTAVESLAHSITHWSSSHICTLCGEMLPNAAALERHKRVYKRAALSQRCNKKKPRKIEADMSWADYKWSCQECSLSLPDIAALRAHTRDVHGKCFAMKCADCLTVLGNFKQFVEHVTAHRECLKYYCPYCNANLDHTDYQNHISTHISGHAPCLGCGQVFPDSASLARHKTLYDAPRVRARGASGAESFTCGVCSKTFPNGTQLRNHKVIHNEKRERDQICHSCGKAFFDAKTLTNHIKTHYTKTETCEICQKTFLTQQRLKVHIATHLELKQFVCNECGKKFRRKSQLRLHLASHSDVLPFQCATCSKSFRLQSYLKIHERQHTGIRPYTCEVCKETFNHWGNCNRHMIRKHGVTFAKTKITAHGKLDINKETGEARKIDIGSVKEWCQEMLKPKKRGRKKKEVT